MAARKSQYDFIVHELLFTVVLMEGKRPRRAVGRFPTKDSAEEWAIADGWERELFVVVPFHD